MKVALCSPPPGNQNIWIWKELLEERGHETSMFSQYDQTYQPDAVLYYGYMPCPLETIRLAQDARDCFGQTARVINSAQSWTIATDKIQSGKALEAAGIPHPSLYPDVTQPVVVKPRFGSRGVDVTCDISYDRAQEISDEYDGDMIIQQYIPSTTCRLVTSSRKVLYAYEKVSDDPLASISQGAERMFFTPDEQLEALAVAAVNAVGGDLMGVDVLKSVHGNFVLELNTGFAVYRADTRVHDVLIDELMWLAKTDA